MPTVLQINSCANWGSTGKIAEQINLAAANYGWNTYIAYGRSVNPSQSKLIHVGNLASQAIALTEARLLDNDGLSSRIATKRFVKKIKEINPNIIHLHNLHGYYINYKILFEYLNGVNIPIVWTLHDCWSFTGHCGHFVVVNCEKWKSHCAICPLKKAYPASLWLDKSANNYDLKRRLFPSNKNLHIVAVSEWMAGLVKQSYLKDVDIRVINNGVNVDVFRPIITEKSNKFNILGVSSVWTQSKGLYDFYRLRDILDEDRYDITLVGLSNDQIKVLPKGINGVARTNSVEELVRYYNMADVFINPTYCDTFPTTNLEALSCGTPVITYRTGGSPESITSEVGEVVEQGNIQCLCKAIYTIQNKGKQNYSTVCRNRAERFYNKEDRFKEYIVLYDELLHGK